MRRHFGTSIPAAALLGLALASPSRAEPRALAPEHVRSLLLAQAREKRELKTLEYNALVSIDNRPLARVETTGVRWKLDFAAERVRILTRKLSPKPEPGVIHTRLAIRDGDRHFTCDYDGRAWHAMLSEPTRFHSNDPIYAYSRPLRNETWLEFVEKRDVIKAWNTSDGFAALFEAAAGSKQHLLKGFKPNGFCGYVIYFEEHGSRYRLRRTEVLVTRDSLEEGRNPVPGTPQVDHPELGLHAIVSTDVDYGRFVDVDRFSLPMWMRWRISDQVDATAEVDEASFRVDSTLEPDEFAFEVPDEFGGVGIYTDAILGVERIVGAGSDPSAPIVAAMLDRGATFRSSGSPPGGGWSLRTLLIAGFGAVCLLTGIGMLLGRRNRGTA